MENKNNQNILKNIYTLFSGNLIATLISTIGTIVIINLITNEEYTFINISYIIPTILILISELGLNFASTHFIASLKKENNQKAIIDIVRINLYIKLILGIFFTFLVIILSNYFSKEIFKINDNRMVLLISISAFGIIGVILFDSINSIFIGEEFMKLVRISSIVRKLIDTILAIALIALGFRLIGPIMGFVLGPLIISIINLIILKKKIYNFNEDKDSINWNLLSKMMKYGYLLSLVSIITGIQTQIYSYIFIYFNLINLVSFFYVSTVSSKLIIILNQSISSTLFPAFSRLDWYKLNERTKIKKYFRFSIKLSNFLVLPVVIILIIFSEEIFPLIYGLNYTSAAPYIALYFFNYLLVSFGSLSIIALFLGQKRPKFVLYIELTKLTFGILFSILLLNYFNGIGIMIGIFLGSVVSVLLGNLLMIFKFEKSLFNYFKESFFAFLINIIVGMLIYFIKNKIIFNHNSVFLNLLFAIILILIYFSILIFFSFYFNIINSREIEIISSYVEQIPILNHLGKILIYIHRRISALHK